MPHSQRASSVKAEKRQALVNVCLEVSYVKTARGPGSSAPAPW